MTRTTGRVLRLLTLLQSRKVWTGVELSDRLRVNGRTIRRDVERLRELGYAIEASAGPGGGYRLAAGNSTPPLLLEDDEAVAVAASLTAAARSVAGTAEVALRVLVKLDQLLPQRLRHRLTALQAVTVAIAPPETVADPFLLMGIATACQDRETLAFTYRDRRGEVTSRSVEPGSLVHTGKVWYLAAWDLDRDDWRTFRVDRIDARAGLERGARFAPREPAVDYATLVSRSLAASTGQHTVRLKLHMPAHRMAEVMPPWLGALDPVDDRSCILSIGLDDLSLLPSYVGHLRVDFELIEPREAVTPLRALAQRILAAIGEE
jgi:predicted DNA-binding transcriptional regulator YafY